MRFKIGIAINRLDALSNWQLRILYEIINTHGTELFVLSVVDNSKKKLGRVSLLKNLVSGNLLSNGLLNVQRQIESSVFFKKPNRKGSVEITTLLDRVESITISLLSKAEIFSFTEETTGVIKERQIDLLLDFTDLDISEENSSLFTYGIWNLLFSDAKLKKRGPIGFYEVTEKHEGIGFTLIGTNYRSKERKVIDTAYFNRGWSMVKTETTVQEAAVSVVIKNIKSLIRNKIMPDTLESVSVSAHKNPSLLSVLAYCYAFYFTVGIKISDRVVDKIGIRSEKWSIFLGEGIFMDCLIANPEPLKMPNDEFWADPFLFEHKGNRYVFFENYSYRTKRGKISCAVIKGDALGPIIDVLDLDYHLSFPFIWEENGEVFLMPETSENKRLEIYKAVKFPTKWELYTTAFEGEAVADAFFYNDEDNQKWLFLNKQVCPASPMDSELYIYKTDSIKLKNLQPHAQNPVIIDSRVARNGGPLFTNNGKVYRPSQRNIDGIYGRALNLNEIETLNINEYKEKTVKVVTPSFDKGLMAMHHLHQFGKHYVFDAAYRRK